MLYQRILKPNSFLLVSLEPIPDVAKAYMESWGIEVIDNMKPNSKAIGKFYDTAEEKFK